MQPTPSNGTTDHSEAESLSLERTERLAINVFCLDRIDPVIRANLLKDKLDLTKPIRTDWDRKDAKDEVALVFKCDLLTAATVCDVIRAEDKKAGDFPTRLYLLRKEWSRIPSYVVLTVMKNDKVVLNPKIFPTVVQLAPLKPIAAKRLF